MTNNKKNSAVTRNAVISLFILAAGVKIIQIIAGNYTPAAGLSGLSGVKEAAYSINSLSDVVVLGLVILALLLIPVYAYQRSKEGKMK